MSAADKLAQVIAEHSRTAWNRDDDDKVTGIVCAGCQHVYEEWPPNRSTVCAHVAAVVLAHLTAEGWAQGREEWGLQYERGADPTMDNPSGVVTNTMTLRDESHARGVLDSPAPISARNKRVVRRRVTDWEPVEGEQP